MSESRMLFYTDREAGPSGRDIEADPHFRLVVDFVSRRIPSNGSCRLLEIGFAHPDFLSYMTTRHRNLEGYGCDVSPARVQQAGSNERVEYKLVDMNECQGAYPNGFFDFIFAGDIIEHLENTDNLLIEAVRYLREGGYLIITTPNLAAWYERLLLLVGMEPLAAEVSYRSRTFGKRLLYRLARVESHPSVGHLRLFTPAALRELGEYYGLVFVEHTGYAHFPFRLNRLISRTYKNLADGIFMVFKKPQVP